MIHITDKRNCCGCAACVQRCPKQCISLKEDEEGFLYPFVDENICIGCGLCEKVCPVLHQPDTGRKPIAVYAAKNKDEEIRRNSSSGGVFSALAERTINEGGVVFGACFDDKWEVIHAYAETSEDLEKFRGSKYVQSRIGNTYKEAEEFLKSGRPVLFSGTPCQIAGLKLFLRKEYTNLLTVDIICHGVPSPSVWRKYLKEEIARQMRKMRLPLRHPITDIKIESISFRDKTLGWKKYSFALIITRTNYNGWKSVITFRTPNDKNPYMRGFLENIYLRPSCFTCPAKCGKSNSDITIGDFWGIEHITPEIDDNKGVNCILINTKHGEGFIADLSLTKYEASYDGICKYNESLIKSSHFNFKSNKFYSDYKTKGVITSISILTRKSLYIQFRELIHNILPNKN